MDIGGGERSCRLGPPLSEIPGELPLRVSHFVFALFC